MKTVEKILLHDGREVSYGDCINLPVNLVLPNLWNPNTMNDREFSFLEENLETIGFVSPIVVVPQTDGTYLIADGAHRLEAQKTAGEKEIPCVIVSSEIFDEKMLMLQTVRMNKIRGSLDPTKFNSLIDTLVNKHGVPFEDLIDELGFANEDDFDALVSQGRQQLPREARKEFDKAVKRVNSIDGLAKLIERLWLKYSDTVPANFFIIDYGNMRHLWVQMSSEHLALITDKFRAIFSLGYKVSSVLQILLEELDVSLFIEQHEERLEKIDSIEQDLDSLLEP